MGRQRKKALSLLVKLASLALVVSFLVWLNLDYFIQNFVLPTEGIRPATYSVQKTEKSFRTKDGVMLVADIFQPVGIQKGPTILVRIPFTNTFYNNFIADSIAKYWASRGYVVALQGTRGRYKSGGTFYPLIHERSDGIETLNWFSMQDWFDGRIAMWGGSAFGHTQWVLSDQESPGPSVLFIQIVSSKFESLFYKGGAFALESALFWTMRSRGSEDRDVDMEMLDKAAMHLPIAESDQVAIGKAEFYHDWLFNQGNSEYWSKVNGIRDLKDLTAPVLLLGGWYDPFLPAQLQDYQEIKEKSESRVAKQTRLIIGPWKHADEVKLPPNDITVPYRIASLAPSLPWFDYILGITDKPSDLPPIRLYVMGINQWRDEHEWPLQPTQFTPYYIQSQGHANTLKGDGVLAREAYDSDKDFDSYIYNPLDPVPSAGGAMLGYRAGVAKQNDIEMRDDVLVYTTSPLKENVEVTGPIKVFLYVATDAPSTDFTGKLIDIYPDGTRFNLSEGILRRKYFINDQIGSSNPTKIEIDLGPTSNVFFKGHKIGLEVSSSNFPLYDQNLNTGEFLPTATKSQIAKQKVYHSKEYPSHILLPIVPTDK